MGVIVSLLEEIRLRLEAAKTAGTITPNAIFMGSVEEARKDNDFPIITINLSGGNLSPECMRHGATEDLAIDVIYTSNKLSDNTNVLYNTTTSTGPIYQIEKILNAIEINRSSSAADLNMNSTTFNALTYSYQVIMSNEGLVHSVITYRGKTSLYQRGAR